MSLKEPIKPKHELKLYIKGSIHTKGEVSIFKNEGAMACQKNATL